MFPFIHHLKILCSCTQIWYAGDASACGVLSDLYHRFELLLSQTSNLVTFYILLVLCCAVMCCDVLCCAVVNDSVKAEVEQVFASLTLSIGVMCNHHYLGGFLGEPAGQDAFV